MVQGEDVGAVHLELAVEIELLEAAEGAEAGVVAHCRHLAAALADGGDEVGPGPVGGEVAGPDLSGDRVVGLDLGRELVERRLAAGDQDQVVPSAGQAPRQLGADARRGAGDEDGRVSAGRWQGHEGAGVCRRPRNHAPEWNQPTYREAVR